MVQLTPTQSRAARGILDWTQQALADAAHVSLSTVRDFEKGRRVPSRNNLLGLRHALETAGVELLEVGQTSTGGEGARLRQG